MAGMVEGGGRLFVSVTIYPPSRVTFSAAAGACTLYRDPQLAHSVTLYSWIAAVPWPDMCASSDNVIVLHSSCVCSSFVAISARVT